MNEIAQTASMHGYFGVKRKKDGEPIGFCYKREESEVHEWLRNDSNPEEQVSGGDDSDISLSDSAAALQKAMENSVETIHAQREVVVTTSAFLPVMETHFMKANIIEPMVKASINKTVVEDGEIYAIPSSPAEWFNPAADSLRRSRLGLEVLPHAVFMGIISNFDSRLSDIIRIMLKMKPDRLHQSGKSVPLFDIVSSNSLDDVINKVINDEIYTLFRGSHQEQVKYIEENFHIEISKYWKRWPDYIELFERRNLIAHGEKKFTERYVSICSAALHKGCESLLGKEISLTISYMHQCLDILSEFTLLLLFSFWKKHLLDQKDQLFSVINSIIYGLIVNKRYIVAIRVADYIINLKNSGATDAAIRMLVINLASAQLHQKDEISCKKTLDSLDWSACADNFKICVAALRKDSESVAKLIPSVVASRQIAKRDFKEWPVFDFIREDEIVQKAFYDLFNEPLMIFDQVSNVGEAQNSSEISNIEDSQKNDEGITAVGDANISGDDGKDTVH